MLFIFETSLHDCISSIFWLDPVFVYFGNGDEFAFTPDVLLVKW